MLEVACRTILHSINDVVYLWNIELIVGNWNQGFEAPERTQVLCAWKVII